MNSGMLGKGYPPGILGSMGTGGGLMSLMPVQSQAPDAGGYGSDAWAEQAGPGAMFWRQLAQMGAYNAMDPTKAAEGFSPEVLALLAPRFQDAAGKGRKGK